MPILDIELVVQPDERLPAPEALAVEVAALTTAIAEVCRRPADQIHIIYQPPAAGRVAFGGRLVPA